MRSASTLLAFALGGAALPTHGQDTAAFKVIFNFDARRTFVNGEPVRFYGFRLGAQRGKDIIAIGFYGLSDAYLREDVDLGDLGSRDLRTEFNYVGLNYERILLDVKRWQIGIPLSIGLGNYSTSYRDSADVFLPYSVNELVPLEATLHVDYKFCWWAFIGVGAGHRYVLAEDPEVTVALSDWTYYLKAGIRLGKIISWTHRKLKGEHGS